MFENIRFIKKLKTLFDNKNVSLIFVYSKFEIRLLREIKKKIRKNKCNKQTDWTMFIETSKIECNLLNFRSIVSRVTFKNLEMLVTKSDFWKTTIESTILINSLIKTSTFLLSQLKNNRSNIEKYVESKFETSFRK